MKYNKIIILYNSRIPSEKANGYQTFKTAESFILNNKEVEIWGPKRFNLRYLANRDVKEYYNLLKTPKIIKIFVFDFLTLIKFENSFSKYLKFLSNIILMLTFSIGVLLRILIKNNKKTIYFTRDVNLAAFLMKLNPSLKNKLFIELHNLPIKKGRKERQIKILNKSRGIFALTNYMKKELSKFNIAERKILYAPDAVDVSQFKLKIRKNIARNSLSLPQKMKIFLYIGKFHTLGNEKGIPEIIKSIKFLNLKIPYKFYIVGGPLDRVDIYKKIVKKNNIDAQKIIFMGRQEIKKIPIWLKSADILLMPHPRTEFYEKYVSPLKLFEYMCSNNPIIASDLESIKEILTNKKNSLLVDPGSAKSIAEAIETLVNNPKFSKKIAKQAFSDINNFSWIKRGNKIINFIQNI